jgi:hypothetical protein
MPKNEKICEIFVNQRSFKDEKKNLQSRVSSLTLSPLSFGIMKN